MSYKPASSEREAFPCPGTVTFPFIISTDRQDHQLETRKLIRSHVMRGKNRTRKRRDSRPVSIDTIEASTAEHRQCVATIPKLVCTEASAVPFADEVDMASISDVLIFLSSVPKAMTLLDQYIAVEKNRRAQPWFQRLLADAAYLHATCLMVSTYYDVAYSRSRSSREQQTAFILYSKAVRKLRERLARDNDEAQLSDSTVTTVMHLASHAQLMGEYGWAQHHLTGLLKIVNLRGIACFLNNPLLLILILRCDLALAIQTSSKPIFFTRYNIPWELASPPEATLSMHKRTTMNESQTDVQVFLDQLNPQLAAVWIAISQFCSLVNVAVDLETPLITEHVFLSSMGSIMYRLLRLRFVAGSLDETVRLGLVAFSGPIFLQWREIKVADHTLPCNYRNSLANLHALKCCIPSRALLWLLVIGATSVFHEPDDIEWLKIWLRPTLESCGISSWNQLQDALNSFLWVGLIYDKPGQNLFQSIVSS